MAKERIFIDNFMTEDGRDLFFVGNFKIWTNEKKHIRADICSDSGYFVEEDLLNDFLEENKDEIEIVEDYRK